MSLYLLPSVHCCCYQQSMHSLSKKDGVLLEEVMPCGERLGSPEVPRQWLHNSMLLSHTMQSYSVALTTHGEAFQTGPSPLGLDGRILVDEIRTPRLPMGATC